MNNAWVYVLRCRDGSLYTGWTDDLARRVARHGAGKASRYTASRRPVELVFAASMTDRSAAMREEARIKRLDRAGKLALISAGAVPSDRRLGGRIGIGGVPASVRA
jgi:putative endonuclease